jgi:hypothetical protein
MFKSLLLLSFLLIVPAVKADPITFDFGSVTALQDAGFTSVNLNAPNLLLAPTSIDPTTGVRSLNVDFNITVDPGQTWTGVVRYDWVLNGVASTTFNTNCSAGCTSEVIHGAGSFLDYTTPFFSPTPVTLTMSVINDAGQVLGSRTFEFNISEPVPEPTTLLLLGSGLAVLSRFRRRWRQ